MATQHPGPTVVSVQEPAAGPSRRTFIAASAAVGGAVTAGGLVAAPAAADPVPAAGTGSSAASRVSLSINGERHTVTVDNRTSLLDLL